MLLADAAATVTRDERQVRFMASQMRPRVHFSCKVSFRRAKRENNGKHLNERTSTLLHYVIHLFLQRILSIDLSNSLKKYWWHSICLGLLLLGAGLYSQPQSPQRVLAGDRQLPGLLLLIGHLSSVPCLGLCLLLPLARGQEDHEVGPQSFDTK